MNEPLYKKENNNYNLKFIWAIIIIIVFFRIYSRIQTASFSSSREREDLLRKGAGTHERVERKKEELKELEKKKKELRAKIVSSDEEEIYKYLHERWDYYEIVDGEYIVEKHDAIVLTETSEKFGIDKVEIDKIIFKIAQIESGGYKLPIFLNEQNVAVEIEIKSLKLLPDRIIEITVENRTKKQITLPTINFNCKLYKENTLVGYSCGISIWGYSLGYRETKTYLSAPDMSWDFNIVEITGYINIDAMKSYGLKSNMQISNDPGESIIPICYSKNVLSKISKIGQEKY